MSRVPTDESYDSLIFDYDRALTYYNFATTEETKAEMLGHMKEIGEESDFRKKYYDDLSEIQT